jgi:hypothetical protein
LYAYFPYLLWNFDILLAMPGLWRLGAFLASRMPGFVSRTICVGFVAVKVTGLFPVFRFFAVSIVPLLRHTAVLTYNRRCIILAIDTVVKKQTQTYPIVEDYM